MRLRDCTWLASYFIRIFDLERFFLLFRFYATVTLLHTYVYVRMYRVYVIQLYVYVRFLLFLLYATVTLR